MSSEMSLSMNSTFDLQATSATGAGVAPAGAYDVTVLFPKATSGKVGGSTDAGSTFNDIAGTAITGSGTNVPSVTLLKARFDFLRATFAGSGAMAIFIRRINRIAPPLGLDRTLNKTISEPVVGTA